MSQHRLHWIATIAANLAVIGLSVTITVLGSLELTPLWVIAIWASIGCTNWGQNMRLDAIADRQLRHDIKHLTEGRR